MSISIGHLGPSGTYSEQAASSYVSKFLTQTQQEATLLPYPSIAKTLKAIATGQVDLAVVPVENSIEGSVAITLDMLWQLDNLKITLALVLPITHALLSKASSLNNLEIVYSHPQALAQCQGWLEQHLPNTRAIAINSTTEALEKLDLQPNAGTISSPRAAELYNVPILASNINDYPDNCTRFWVLSSSMQPVTGSHTSLAFSTKANVPGALVKPLQMFAQRGINLSRVESRPSKRSLGDYLFFLDLEGDTTSPAVQTAISELAIYTDTLKIFGSYDLLFL
ncbi:prephenate dehydratase [Synechocystis sp. PCC 7509]|uniref:prephenate dehydratase n=1 Tax=Synechocystis sp. PCC 7509 TaxID=927677 RepID=UPI0002ACDF02|nr:prephenate dehydratase [Synechocystis sp. PCC 7509]